MQNFQYYLDLACSNQTFSIAPDWAQGRSVFGGLSAALILHRIETQEPLGKKQLQSLSVNFCGPLEVETPCEIQYSVLSNGKSISQIQGQLLQNKEVKTQITACFGLTRESSIHVSAADSQPKNTMEKASPFPYIKGVTPEFIQHLQLGLLNNAFPFSGVSTTDVLGWMKFKEAPTKFSNPALIALIDAWPPAVLPMLKKPAPASSITWNVEFTEPGLTLEKDSSVYYECDVTQAHHGYAHTEAKIYHPNGQLIALSRQLVGIYDIRSKPVQS